MKKYLVIFAVLTSGCSDLTPQQYAALKEAGMALQGIPSTTVTTRGGILQESYVSGMNRICLYGGVGGDYAVTIGATELCPLSN